MGSCMKYTRLVGTEPHNSVVQRRCCMVCHTPIYDRRPVKVDRHYKFHCASCGGLVQTQLLVVDDWHQVHAVESERHKFSRVPAHVLHDRGSDEAEARAERAKSRDPAAQAWFEFSKDDTWLYTDRFPTLHILCSSIVAQMVPVAVTEAAKEVFVRAGSDAATASKNVAWMIRQAADMMRENQIKEDPSQPPRIRRKFFSSHFDMNANTMRSYTKVYTDDKGARQGVKYRPPLAVLLDEVEKAVRDLESRF
jgi:hypothetical protein